MAQEAVQLSGMRRAQEGAAGWVFLIVVAALVWWQWDWIMGLFGGGAGGGAAEVVSYRCERAEGRAAVDGTVRNATDATLGLRVVTAIYDSSGKKSDYFEASVQPRQLKPGEVGSFSGTGPALPDGGSCRLDHFVDTATGKPARKR